MPITPHPTALSSSSTYNQLPLSVVQTFNDDATQSQDGPVDFSVTSRWTQSIAAAVKNDAATAPKGSTDFLPIWIIIDIIIFIYCFLLLPRYMECRHGLAMRILSVCPSVVRCP